MSNSPFGLMSIIQIRVAYCAVCNPNLDAQRMFSEPVYTIHMCVFCLVFLCYRNRTGIQSFNPNILVSFSYQSNCSGEVMFRM